MNSCRRSATCVTTAMVDRSRTGRAFSARAWKQCATSGRPNLPLFVRISSTDWVDNGWDIDQSVELARALGPLDVDLFDCSSGGNVATAKIPVGPGYQTPFAERIRRDTGILTGAVGLITSPHQA